MLPACLVATIGEAREHVEPTVDVGARPRVAPGVRAETQVLVDGELGERAATLRHVRDARRARPARASCPSIDSPSNVNAPRAGIIPDSARNVVVLPAPFAPRITTTSPSSTVKSTPYSTCTGP